MGSTISPKTPRGICLGKKTDSSPERAGVELVEDFHYFGNKDSKPVYVISDDKRFSHV